jgi:hypothetical protein
MATGVLRDLQAASLYWERIFGRQRISLAGSRITKWVVELANVLGIPLEEGK